MKQIRNFLIGILSALSIFFGGGTILFHIGKFVLKHVFNKTSELNVNYYIHVAGVVGVALLSLLAVILVGLLLSWLIPAIVNFGEDSVKFYARRLYGVKAFFRDDTKIR